MSEVTCAAYLMTKDVKSAKPKLIYSITTFSIISKWLDLLFILLYRIKILNKSIKDFLPLANLVLNLKYLLFLLIKINTYSTRLHNAYLFLWSIFNCNEIPLKAGETCKRLRNVAQISTVKNGNEVKYILIIRSPNCDSCRVSIFLLKYLFQHYSQIF